MKIAPSFQRVARERAVAVEPAPAARVSDAFLRRLNHYPGRTLTRSSLDLEATHRMRHLALTGMNGLPAWFSALKWGSNLSRKPKVSRGAARKPLRPRK